jgi:peptidyl-prolyl cis-trans isomerase C
VSSADVAQKVIEQLKGGADFGNLAKRVSARQGSAAKGGDLDWFSPPRWTRPFRFARAAQERDTPDAGADAVRLHVIQMLGTRDRTPPAFEDVKERLSQIIMAKKFKAIRTR